mgnify:CR=1 FL=1
MLELAALILALVHFGFPLTYYWYAKTRWLHRPWNVKVDANFKPSITIIVPTYNESELIMEKLNNLYSQDYPKSLLKVIVVDSASTDGTADIVEKWIAEHTDFNVKLIREEERRGKASALNLGLKYVEGDVVFIADVDAFWPVDAVSKTVAWLADFSIGAISCIKEPMGGGTTEHSYRRFYNVLRIAESKAYATPIFHGELAAFKRELLERVGGFPTEIGADDSHTATLIALEGYRAIIPEETICKERIPKKGHVRWRIRRAQHLIQHFIKVLKMRSKAPAVFRTILEIEAFLHLVNPWVLALAATILIALAIMGSWLSAVFLVAGIMLLIYPPYRMWIVTQAYLAIAAVRNVFTKELVWEKQKKD